MKKNNTALTHTKTTGDKSLLRNMKRALFKGAPKEEDVHRSAVEKLGGKLEKRLAKSGLILPRSITDTIQNIHRHHNEHIDADGIAVNLRLDKTAASCVSQAFNGLNHYREDPGSFVGEGMQRLRLELESACAALSTKERGRD